MADNAGNDNNALYMIVGGLIVVVVLGFLYFNGNLGGGGRENADVNITLPAPPSPSVPAIPSAPAAE